MVLHVSMRSLKQTFVYFPLHGNHDSRLYPVVLLCGDVMDFDSQMSSTVFCDPQVVLTKVTELVEYHHKLRDCPDKGVAAELTQ